MEPVHPSKVSLRLGLRAYRDVLNFAARATRTEVFSLWLFQMGLTFCVVMFHFALPVSAWRAVQEDSVMTALRLLFLLPWFALLARRLNDQNLPGNLGAIVMAVVLALAWYLEADQHEAIRDSWGWLFFALAGNIAFLVALFRAETPGPNRYGPDPRDRPQSPPRDPADRPA